MINISSRNILGRVYNIWVRCDGRPRYQEDLCHFMRVCMFWWWLRWFFSGRFIEINEFRPEWNGLSPFVSIILGNILVLYGVGWYRFPLDTLYGTLVVAAIVGGISIVIIGTENKWGDRIEWFLGDVKDAITDQETISVIMEWLAAKKKGICPFIEVEKKKKGD